MHMTPRIGPKRPYRLYIREWIKEKNLTQKQVAERMECEEGTLSKLINGKMGRTDDWLASIAHALDIDVEHLFRDPKRPTQQDLLDGVSDEKRDEIIRVIRAMTDEAGEPLKKAQA